ncbi:MAG: protein kinase, partial [Myxococcota bacterium]
MRPSEKYDFGSVDTLIGDRYRLLSEIGRGTSATVYRALDTQDESECAVKVGEAPQGSNREQRFLREAAIACQIRHTNVVRSNDYGIEDGFLYLVMEFLHGETLGSCL